ncbi:MAG: VanW family protein [Bacteroidota bacterium]
MTRPLSNLLPSSWRGRLREASHHVRQVLDRTYFSYARNSERTRQLGKQFDPRISHTQPILPGTFADNHAHNLRLAAQSINRKVIFPGEIFSFWHFVGIPSVARTYKIGQGIIDDEPNAVQGGGLSQMSSALYYLGLQAGLEILERHAPPVDPYGDKGRPSPLGTEAEVHYGETNLRMRNSLPYPIAFCLRANGLMLQAHLCTPNPIEALKVEFVVARQQEQVSITTLRHYRNGKTEHLGKVDYAQVW